MAKYLDINGVTTLWNAVKTQLIETQKGVMTSMATLDIDGTPKFLEIGKGTTEFNVTAKALIWGVDVTSIGCTFATSFIGIEDPSTTGKYVNISSYNSSNPYIPQSSTVNIMVNGEIGGLCPDSSDKILVQQAKEIRAVYPIFVGIGSDTITEFDNSFEKILAYKTVDSSIILPTHEAGYLWIGFPNHDATAIYFDPTTISEKVTSNNIGIPLEAEHIDISYNGIPYIVYKSRLKFNSGNNLISIKI